MGAWFSANFSSPQLHTASISYKPTARFPSFSIMAIALWGCMLALLSRSLSHAAAGVPTYVTFPGSEGVTLSGILYTPERYEPRACCLAGMVLMHGCTGIWSFRKVNRTSEGGTWNLQNHIEKWGLKLASRNMVALVLDSFTPRVPPGLSVFSEDWQYQCNDGMFPNRVSPYTTRVADARAAWRYLVSLGTIGSNKIGLMGWSQGAETAMTESAATPRERNEERDDDDYLFAVLVGFYPGCGDHMQFGTVASSFWRPYMEFMLNVGEKDGFYANCKSRVQTSTRDYPNIVINYPEYELAGHSFDQKSRTWPTSKCTIPIILNTADACAMSAADIDSLAFIETFLVAPTVRPEVPHR